MENSPSPLHNPDLLRRQRDADDDAWRVRRAIHETYTDPNVDFAVWALALIGLRGDERLLEIGSAEGRYYQVLHDTYPGVRYVGIDEWHSGLRRHHAQGRLTRAHQGRLPFADGTFDVVLAGHVLYLAPDVEGAVAECRRVLRRGGVLAATTNSAHTMQLFSDLFRRAIRLVMPTHEAEPPQPAHTRFSLEEGPRLLSRTFPAVVRHDLPGTLVFDKRAPIMDYLHSTRAFNEPQLPRGVSWEAVMQIMQHQVDYLLQHLSLLSVDKLSGLLIATDNGYWADGYCTARQAAFDAAHHKPTPSPGDTQELEAHTADIADADSADA